jgi:DNA topoisomerase-1
MDEDANADANGSGPAHAAAVGLRYASDDEPGIRRIRRGRGFSYVGPDGRPVADQTRKRIEALAVPPAWTDVWLATDPRAHLQATGRDARGRKQYRYHAKWRSERDRDKFDRMATFGSALGDIRAEVDGHLRERGLSREKIVAAVVGLLDETLVRVGNEVYSRENGTFGLTTLRRRHLREDGGGVTFVSKGGVRRAVAFSDPRLVRIARKCHELGGKRLFSYLDDEGALASVSSSDVNDFLSRIAGQAITAKDFRTWGGTCTAATSLVRTLEAPEGAATPRNGSEPPTRPVDPVLAAIDEAAEALGNTRAVCRASYVHPVIFEAFEDGRLAESWSSHRSGKHLDRIERAVHHLVDPTARS